MADVPDLAAIRRLYWRRVQSAPIQFASAGDAEASAALANTVPELLDYTEALQAALREARPFVFDDYDDGTAEDLRNTIDSLLFDALAEGRAEGPGQPSRKVPLQVPEN